VAIREVYQGPGSFTVEMGVATPHLMSTVARGGYLVITPQYMGDPRGFTNSSLLAAAKYTGIVLETIWTDGILTLEGAGLDWLLGDLDGIGPSGNCNYSSDTISTVISLDSGVGIIPAGAFTIGSTITGSGTYTANHPPEETVKEVITQVMASFGNHYKISPNGEINTEATTGNTVYKSTPTVVFVRDNWGSDAMWTGVPVDRLTSKYSIREWLSSSNVDIYGLQDGLIYRVDNSDAAVTRTIGGAEALIQEVRTTYAHLGDSTSVGDMVYIFDPGSGFEGDTLIKFRGQWLKPARHRIREYSWPVTDGMGVYYRPQGSSITISDWIDLTQTTQRVPAATATASLKALEFTITEAS